MNVKMFGEICDAFGPSGFEEDVIRTVAKYCKGLELENDAMNNLYARMPGEDPEKPVVMWQYGLQFMHLPVLAFGQRRFSMACPCSIMTIFSGEPRRSSSSAVKIPAGPAPTMTTSAFIVFSPRFSSFG